MDTTSTFWPQLTSLVVAAVAVMGSPGPSTLSVTALGSAFGLRRSLPYLAGCIAGTSVVLAAVAAGVVSMLVSAPGLSFLLLVLAGAYLVYLAIRIATAPPPSRPDMRSKPPAFAGGFTMAVANPKAYVAIAAVFAGSTLAAGSPALDSALKTGVLVVMIVVVHVVWLLAGAGLSRWLYRPAVSRAVNLVFAALLLATTLFAVLHH